MATARSAQGPANNVTDWRGLAAFLLGEVLTRVANGDEEIAGDNRPGGAARLAWSAERLPEAFAQVPFLLVTVPGAHGAVLETMLRARVVGCDEVWQQMLAATNGPDFYELFLQAVVASPPGCDYLAGIAGFRPHDVYSMRPLRDLPFPCNPSRCELFDEFETIARQRPKGRLRRRFGGSRAISLGEQWNRWLIDHPEDVDRCRFHRYDLAGASQAASRLWTGFSQADWTRDAVEQAISEEVPAELRLGTRSLIFDPVVVAPDGSDTINGQHRICSARLGGVDELFCASC